LTSHHVYVQGLSCSGQTVVCGAHGQLDSNCECNCEEGWTTEPFQASSDVQYCNLSTSEGKQQASNSKRIVLDHHHQAFSALAWLVFTLL